MLPPHQLQEAQKKNPTMPVVVVLLSFPFLQILTNQPQNRQRRTSKKNYLQKKNRKYDKIYTEGKEPPLPIDLTLKSQHWISLPIWFWGYREREREREELILGEIERSSVW